MRKKKPLPGTQQGRAQNFGQNFVFQKRLGYNFQIAMSGAADPINPMTLFFHSFKICFAKVGKSQIILNPISILILYFLIVLHAAHKAGVSQSKGSVDNA